ncbi:Putative zinc ribbon domain-containing protein [Chitinophaga rupis]|uniref:Putative zinc ribbon domain-containing protein n=1 Tax=Chitinophaga rupis TaxID=573321 RepID=A0A1H7Q020_9BACT|nr:zinc ribbon domain-containing protein [Chitinophaga rupis]SEL41186.1 Putative zinc ribbon domain-containing protein [Chitinophaga rupis]
MENNQLCQSCSMPINDPAMAGTEKDGSPSREYCKYCYQNGTFTSPDMTLDDMRSVVKREMEKRNIGEDIITLATNSLPHLKRWQKKMA